ncbi:MAG: hypothetical protein ABIH72_01585 [archaeon]
MFVKRSQSSVEYLIVIGFVTFAVMSILVVAFYYSGVARDRIRVNQLEIFSQKIINSAEAVFFAGEPSKSTFSIYVPEGVYSISIPENDYYLVVSMSTSSGQIVRAFDSKVPINGTISASNGIKTIVMEAHENYVQIN